jgi:hypothetical protein
MRSASTIVGHPSNAQNAILHLMLAVLFTHELDAMLQAEWRLLYVLRDMPSADAAHWFIVLHVPLFALILWLTHHKLHTIRQRSRYVAAAFMIVHAALHFRLRDDPLNTFVSPLSLTLIYGGAVIGIVYLLFAKRSGDQRVATH